MDFSSLPTDNLYKFLALSGVVIILFFIYLNVRYRVGIWARLDAVRRRQALFDAEYEALKLVNKNLESLLEAVKEGPPEAIREIISKRETVWERFAKLDALNKTIGVDAASIVRLEGQLRWLNRLSLAALIVGLAMASFGFGLWYYKVQVYEDEELRLKVVQPPETVHGPDR